MKPFWLVALKCGPQILFYLKLLPTYGFKFETPELERGSKTKQKKSEKMTSFIEEINTWNKHCKKSKICELKLFVLKDFGSFLNKQK